MNDTERRKKREKEKRKINDYLIASHSRHTDVTLTKEIWLKIKLWKKINVDFIEWWCPRTDSNRGPIDYKSIALPAELQGHAQ